MALKYYIKDGCGNGYDAKVTSRGQLVTAPLEFSESYQLAVNATSTGFNFAGPVTSKRFVVTDIILEAGKTVSTSVAATVEIYEADSATETTVVKAILTFDMIRYAVRTLNGLNLIISEGKWLNIKTTDATINATILGYYVDA